MGGNNSEEESRISFLNRVYGIGYKIIDFMTFRHFSLKEENKRLSGRLTGINSAYRAREEGLRKQIGSRECANKRMSAENTGLNTEVKKRGERISELEEKLAETNKGLVLTGAKLAEAERAYEEQGYELTQVREDLASLSSGLEAFMMDHYYEFIEILDEVRELRRKMGKEDVDDITLTEGVLFAARHQRKAVAEAGKEVERMKAEVEKSEREGVLFQAAVMYTDDIKTPIIVVDGNGWIKLVSEPAIELVGYNPVGKQIGKVYSRMEEMIRDLIPTHENGFYADNLVKDSVLEVHMRRTARKEYISSVLIVGDKKQPWWRRERTRYDSLNDVVSQAVAYDKAVPIDLRKMKEIPDEFAERLYGLSKSNFFREKTKIIVRHQKVYDKLLEYSIPENMIIHAPLAKGEPGKELGLEPGLLPERA